MEGLRELWEFLVEDHEKFRGYFERHVLDEAEAARERGDGEGGIEGEGALENVEPDRAGIREYEARNIFTGRVVDHVWEYEVL